MYRISSRSSPSRYPVQLESKYRAASNRVSDPCCGTEWVEVEPALALVVVVSALGVAASASEHGIDTQ
jgi:hypothetical protein